MDRAYEFVGVVNLFDLYPDFLFPIYKNQNWFFFHNGDKNRIYNFEPVTETIIDKIIYLDCEDVVINNRAKNKYYFEHDSPVYAFQNNIREIFCAEADEMVEYLKTFRTRDRILSKQILHFVKENSMELYINHLCSSVLDSHYVVTPVFSEKPSLSSKRKLSDLIPGLRINYDENCTRENGIYHQYMNLIDTAYFKARLGYDINHELYNMEYCTCRMQNIAMVSADFTELKKAFHKLITELQCDSLYYDVCITCQKAIIDKDENELIITINKNRQLFIELLRENIMEKYLATYIGQHIRTYSSKWS